MTGGNKIGVQSLNRWFAKRSSECLKRHSLYNDYTASVVRICYTEHLSAPKDSESKNPQGHSIHPVCP